MAGERTEQATPQRLKQLREQGRVVKSQDLITALELAVGLWCIQQFGGETAHRLRLFMENGLLTLARRDLNEAVLADLMGNAGVLFLTLTAPILVVMPLLAIVSNVGQMGFILNGKVLMPDFKRINPLSGLQRLFSLRSGFELAKQLVKVGLVGWLLSRPLSENAVVLLSLAGTDFQAAAPQLVKLVLDVAMSAAGVLFAIAALDYGYQRWDFMRNAMMSREELREELRQQEGDPQMKGRIRQLQRKMARNRMMADVPKATVVVTNPTHFAVALQYAAGEMFAPKVVAKGADHVAAKIREIAVENGVPLVENKPLAQALFKTVEVGTEIPGELFQAVAEVLAYIYMLKQRGSVAAPRPRSAAEQTAEDGDGYGV